MTRTRLRGKTANGNANPFTKCKKTDLVDEMKRMGLVLKTGPWREVGEWNQNRDLVAVDEDGNETVFSTVFKGKTPVWSEELDMLADKFPNTTRWPTNSV